MRCDAKDSTDCRSDRLVYPSVAISLGRLLHVARHLPGHSSVAASPLRCKTGLAAGRSSSGRDCSPQSSYPSFSLGAGVTPAVHSEGPAPSAPVLVVGNSSSTCPVGSTALRIREELTRPGSTSRTRVRCIWRPHHVPQANNNVVAAAVTHIFAIPPLIAFGKHALGYVWHRNDVTMTIITCPVSSLYTQLRLECLGLGPFPVWRTLPDFLTQFPEPHLVDLGHSLQIPDNWRLVLEPLDGNTDSGKPSPSSVLSEWFVLTLRKIGGRNVHGWFAAEAVRANTTNESV